MPPRQQQRNLAEHSVTPDELNALNETSCCLVLLITPNNEHASDTPPMHAFLCLNCFYAKLFWLLLRVGTSVLLLLNVDVSTFAATIAEP